MQPSSSKVLAAIRTLEISRDAPCTCHGTCHEMECQAGRACLAAAIKALSWALGHENDFPQMLATLRRMQARRSTASET